MTSPTLTRSHRRFRSFRRLRSKRAAMASLAFLLLLIVCAVLAPVLAPHDPNALDLGAQLQGPSTSHWLGTDALGRDLLSRLLFGTRVTLLAAFEGVGLAVVLGIPIGLLSGYVGRWLDLATNAVADAMLTIPPLLLSMAIVGVLGPGLTNAMIAVGVILSPRFFRVARAAAHSVAHETYIEASRAAGCSMPRVLWRHVLPNASGPMLVQVSFSVGLAIIAEATLSFLGLGVQPPSASLGSMVRASYETISRSSWSLYPPSVMILLTILAFSLLGDGVRDALGRVTSDE